MDLHVVRGYWKIQILRSWLLVVNDSKYSILKNMDTIEEIIKLKALLDQGAITKGEFNSLKKKVLFEDTDFQEPQKTSAPSSIESGIGSEVINDANTVQKEINKKPS